MISLIRRAKAKPKRKGKRKAPARRLKRAVVGERRDFRGLGVTDPNPPKKRKPKSKRRKAPTRRKAVRRVRSKKLPSYEKFRSSVDWHEAKAELEREAAMAWDREGRRMFITRHTILGRMRQRKLEAYNAAKRRRAA